MTGSDVDGDTLTFTVTVQPSNGSLSGTAPDLQYTPNANFNGPDTFQFVASDPFGSSNPATVSIAVSPVNDLPTATAQSVGTPEDNPLGILLTGSDVEGDTLTFNVTVQPANGTLSGTAPSLQYQPNADFNGTDTFQFVARDLVGSSDPAIVDIAVSAENDQPVANSQSVTRGRGRDTADRARRQRRRRGQPVIRSAGSARRTVSR